MFRDVIQSVMVRSQTVSLGAIERAVRATLGTQRVRSVASEEKINDDGAAVIRVLIVYDASKGLSVEEMESVVDAVWLGRASDESPFPVIDFQEDTDLESVAAE